MRLVGPGRIAVALAQESRPTAETNTPAAVPTVRYLTMCGKIHLLLDCHARSGSRASLRVLQVLGHGRTMADSFSLEQLARLRDDARRLALRAAQHEDSVRRHLEAAEANLDQVRTAWSDHGAFTPAGSLSQALRTQMVHSYVEVDAAQQLCVTATENQQAAERLVTDLGARSNGKQVTPAVLVVDDYEDSREWLSVVLVNAGFSVRSAANGLEALLAAYDLQPAVIVMDLMMPVLDGMEAARLIKAIDELRNTRVIAYTARTPAPTTELFTAVLRKPSPPDVVVETVKRWAAA
jgi:CheY-like chemotaxis protein